MLGQLTKPTLYIVLTVAALLLAIIVALIITIGGGFDASSKEFVSRKPAPGGGVYAVLLEENYHSSVPVIKKVSIVTGSDKWDEDRVVLTALSAKEVRIDWESADMLRIEVDGGRVSSFRSFVYDDINNNTSRFPKMYEVRLIHRLEGMVN